MADEKKKVEVEIQEQLEIDEAKLDEELQRQPARFFYWATSWAMAGRKAKQLKLKSDEVEGRLCREFRMKMAEEDPKFKATEKVLNDYVSEHPDYRAAKEEQIQAEYVMDMLGIAKDAFRERHQAIVELYKSKSESSFFERQGLSVMQEELEARRTKKKIKEA